MDLKYKNYLVVLTIIMVEIAIWSETDIFIPSMPNMVEFFHIKESSAQLILSSNFLGLFISAFFAGPISDNKGRKKTILTGMTIFTLSSWGCAFSDNFLNMLIFRFLQGIGAGIPMVLAWVILMDIYTQKELVYIAGFINSGITAITAGAPIVGNYINNKYNWRINFYLIFFFSIFVSIMVGLFIYESNPKEKRKKISILSITKDYKKLLKMPIFTGNVLLYSFGYSCIMVYISNMSIIFINHLKVNREIFGYLQASTMISYMIASFLGSKLIAKYAIRNTNYIGSYLVLFGSFALWLTSIFFETSVGFICISMNIFSAGVAISINIVANKAMRQSDELKGSASSLSTVMRLIIISIMIQLSSMLFTGGIGPIASIIFIITLLLFFIHLKIDKLEKLNERKL